MPKQPVSLVVSVRREWKRLSRHNIVNGGYGRTSCSFAGFDITLNYQLLLQSIWKMTNISPAVIYLLIYFPQESNQL